MAAVLDAFAPYVKKLIADVAQEEVSMLLGVSSEITKLEDNMEGLKAFLADAERRRVIDMSVQRWVTKLKKAMYDATDILDLCQLEADRRRKSSGDDDKVYDCFQPLVFCLRNPKFAHKIGSRIKELNKRLEGIYKDADKFKFNIGIGIGYNPEPRRLTTSEWSSQRMTSDFDASTIFGETIENDTKELGHMLTNSDSHDVKVMSIVGTGGMGKTTLAQKIFNDTSVQVHFKIKIWLSITQQFDGLELLRTAIEQAGGDHGRAKDKTLLTRKLIETLSTGRFLMVLDDVWSDQAWSQELCVPIKNASQKQSGNWVLITTRLGDLAQRMRASFYQHQVSPLNEEDAWSLLKKQLPPPPSQVAGTDHLKDVGMKIINKCGGLPLAVKVMGGLLSTRSPSESDWEAVLNHSAWSVTGLPEELDNRIYLSYEDLSPQLKQCFLYCSLFPKDTTIWRSVVVPMWISEGFIEPKVGSSSHVDDRLEETGNGYYLELITRNLIEPREESSLTRYTCTMHDVVRAFAEFMAREDSLVVQEGSSSNGSLVRRMSLSKSKLIPNWDIIQKQKSLRTLLIDCDIKFEPSDSLTSLSGLRLLSITGADCDRFVGCLGQLVHLRYLFLKSTDISRLPDDISRMKFLEHIVVLYSKNLECLPRTITKLVHLRTLNIYGSNVNVVVPKGFGRLTNLRTLKGFQVHMDMDRDGGWCSLEEIGPLSQLRSLTLHGLENVAPSSLAEMAMISSKEHLDYLELHWSSSRFMGQSHEIQKQQQQRAAEEVIELLRPASSIRHLDIDAYFGCQLPNWMMVLATSAFKSLRILRMDKLCCCTQLPNGLCQLPSLELLDINDAPAVKNVGPDFQSSPSSVVAFPQLKTLRLAGLSEWEEWDWQEQAEDEAAGAMAMPAVEGISIENCKLTCLPPGLASCKRLALRELFLYDLSSLTSVENFPSVVELRLKDCPMLKRISSLSRLQKISIFRCPNTEVLEGVPSLYSVEMMDGTMETLPEYVREVTPRYLKLTCSRKLYESMLAGCSSSEYHKISHIQSRTIDYIAQDEQD